MADLDPAHVEAVADALDTAQDEHEQNYLNACARYLLTSTDPAVHAALLAALVRAGVLSEESRRAFHGHGFADPGWRRWVSDKRLCCINAYQCFGHEESSDE